MPRKISIAGVFLAALVWLGWGAGAPGIATGYVDPIARIQAQDEAVYGSTSFAMAAGASWLTPRFLGRYALYKPPLLYWLCAPSVKLLGRGALALRLPSILAGAATAAIVFAWAGWEAAVLLLSSHLFFALSRMGLTDALLTLEIVLAMLVLARSPRLDTRAARWTFGLASGAAILTKGAAGALPLLILIAFALVSPDRPAWSRIAQAAAIAVLLAAPWHLYQLGAHPRWFWAEYVRTEIFSFGLSSPEQTTPESPTWFYAKRLVLLDPVLLSAALYSLTRRRPRLPLAWLLVVLAAALIFQYRNAAYLLPAYPALAILWGQPFKAAAALLRGVGLAFFLVVKILAPSQPWGLTFAPEFVNPSYALLNQYTALHRGNDLILIEPDDQFYSADLHLPRVRYLYLDPRADRPRLPLDLEFLGVLVSAVDFNRLTEMRPRFEARLREWNLTKGDPMATTILARTPDEIAAVIAAHPGADFFAPTAWAARDQGLHQAWNGDAARTFLLSREMIQRP